MVELITTGIITGSSVLLFGYWLRFAYLLVFGEGVSALPQPQPSRTLGEPVEEIACLVDSDGREVPARD